MIQKPPRARLRRRFELTDLQIAILLGIVATSALAGHAIKRWISGPTRWLLFIFAALLPLIAYTIFGISEGCLLSESNDPETCFGFGFGLVLLIPFGMPPWLFGLCLGAYFTRPAQAQ